MLHTEVCPHSCFSSCGYSQGPWVFFVTAYELSERVTNIASRIGVSCTQSQPFSFLPHFFDSMKWPLIVRKRDNFESRKSPKSGFTKIWVLCPDFVGWESFLEWNSLSDLTQLISKWSQMILTRWITF